MKIVLNNKVQMEKRKTAWISQTSRSSYSSTSSMTEVAEIEVNVGDILN